MPNGQDDVDYRRTRGPSRYDQRSLSEIFDELEKRPNPPSGSGKAIPFVLSSQDTEESEVLNTLQDVSISFQNGHLTVGGSLQVVFEITGFEWMPSPQWVNCRITKKMKREARNRIGYSRAHTNIAVVGRQGMGKSTFVNSVRGGKGSVAATGTTKTTVVPHLYTDDLNLHFRWYDLPGAGTKTTSEYLYYHRHLLFAFDIIVVVHEHALSEFDQEIIRLCDEIDQTYLLVRSKADVSIRNEMHDSKLSAQDARKLFISKVTAEPSGTKDHIICRTATRAAALGVEAPPNECEQFIDEWALMRRLRALGPKVHDN